MLDKRELSVVSTRTVKRVTPNEALIDAACGGLHTRIYAARRYAGLSQAEADELSGLGGSWSHYETGRRFPKIPHLLRICAVLECGVEDMLFGAGTRVLAKPTRER